MSIAVGMELLDSTLVIHCERRIKYALCKHGPHHRYQFGGCEFAHSLNEVSMPKHVNPKQWRDESHVPGGPCGIDYFAGQALSRTQFDRMLGMRQEEGLWHSTPACYRAFGWFIGLGNPNEYVCDGDFDWYAFQR